MTTIRLNRRAARSAATTAFAASYGAKTQQAHTHTHDSAPPIRQASSLLSWLALICPTIPGEILGMRVLADPRPTPPAGEVWRHPRFGYRLADEAALFADPVTVIHAPATHGACDGSSPQGPPTAVETL